MVRKLNKNFILFSDQVWRALLQHMPLVEMMGNLSKMTSLGLLDTAGKHSQAPLVIDRLKNDTLIKDSRYPALDMILKYYQTRLSFTRLISDNTYKSGTDEIITYGSVRCFYLRTNGHVVLLLEKGFGFTVNQGLLDFAITYSKHYIRLVI